MDAEALKVFAQVAGIGGIALGTFLVLFRELIRKSIFSTLTKDHAYRLLRLIALLTWSVAIAGVGAWVYVENKPATADPSSAVSAGRDLTARDISVEAGSSGAPQGNGVSAGRDLDARDISIKR